MKTRRCNKYGCDGIMRPTREIVSFDGVIPKPFHRVFKCTVCGKENPWLDKPEPNGGHGELHHIGHFDYSGLSMLSDLEFYPPRLDRPKRTRR